MVDFFELSSEEGRQRSISCKSPNGRVGRIARPAEVVSDFGRGVNLLDFSWPRTEKLK